MNNFDKVTRLEVDIKDLDLGIGQEEEGPAGLDVSKKSRLSEVGERETGEEDGKIFSIPWTLLNCKKQRRRKSTPDKSE